MKRQYKIIQPTLASLFEEECKQLMSQVQLLRETLQLIQITAFIKATSDDDFFVKKHIISHIVKDDCGDIPVGVLSQSPSDDFLIVLEVCGVEKSLQVEYKRWSDSISYSVITEGSEKSIMATGLCMELKGSEYPPAVSLQSELSFTEMASILATEGFSFDNVVRQWNYIPRLVDEVEIQGKMFQNYQLFNEIRQKYYAHYKKEKGYPAATGIGTDAGTVMISFFAVSDLRKPLAFELTNPHQIDAYKYSEEVLVGAPLLEEKKKTPLFERGKALREKEEFTTLFISGTASILGEETVHIGDVVGQTHVTIDNINALMENSALRTKAIDLTGVKQVKYLRAYVKYYKDIESVRVVCEERFGEALPIVYIESSVCRDDLLVEIEGEFSV